MKSLKVALGIGVYRRLHTQQKGVATILVILMIGVGVIAVSAGTLHTLRNTQERQLVAQSQVNAQAGAWAAVEVVRKVLGTLDKQQLATLNGNTTWGIRGTEGLTQSAHIKTIESPVGTAADFKITAEVSAIAAAGQSSSTIEVVYAVTPAGTPGVYNLAGALDFYNDLVATGGIVLDAPSRGMDFNVDGDFNATSLSITGTGLRNVSVTGNVTMDSDVHAELLRARNVTINGGATARVIEAFGKPVGDPGSVGTETSKARGDTCCGTVRLNSWGASWAKDTNGTPLRSDVKANGLVYSGGAGASKIAARKSVVLSSGGAVHGDITTLVDLTASGSGSIGVVRAGRNVTINDTSTASISAVGQVTCSGTVAHNISAAVIDAACIPGIHSIGVVAAPQVDELPPVTLAQPKVDAYTLKGAANYVIEFVSGKVQVTVKNVNGLQDGVYYIGSYGSYVREYLCKAIETNSTNKCDASVQAMTSAQPFCVNSKAADPEYDKCFGFDPTTKTMSLSGSFPNMAIPTGVIWIDGSFNLATGPYFNTFIATKNITTSGQLATYAINYAAAYDNKTPPSNAVCKNQYGTATYTAFNGLYPTNFCSATGVFTPSPIGNLGLLAGGYDPVDNPNNTKTVYSGGVITLAAGNEVFGTVAAGNLLKTSGNTTIHGYISAAGLQQDPNVTNNLGGKTEVNLNNLPDTYKPGEIPDMSGGATGVTAESKVLWTRYL
jgi:hypothetical protein